MIGTSEQPVVEDPRGGILVSEDGFFDVEVAGINRESDSVVSLELAHPAGLALPGLEPRLAHRRPASQRVAAPVLAVFGAGRCPLAAGRAARTGGARRIRLHPRGPAPRRTDQGAAPAQQLRAGPGARVPVHRRRHRHHPHPAHAARRRGLRRPVAAGLPGAQPQLHGVHRRAGRLREQGAPARGRRVRVLPAPRAARGPRGGLPRLCVRPRPAAGFHFRPRRRLAGFVPLPVRAIRCRSGRERAGGRGPRVHGSDHQAAWR